MFLFFEDNVASFNENFINIKTANAYLINYPLNKNKSNSNHGKRNWKDVGNAETQNGELQNKTVSKQKLEKATIVKCKKMKMANK